MPYTSVNWNEIKHLRFLSFLSNETLELLKEQVYRTLRDQEKDDLFEQFMRWQRKENEIMLYSDYSSISLDLPVNFDSILQSTLSVDRIDVKVVIPYSILNGWAAISKIEKGHRNVCLLQFDEKVPDIIKDLPEVNSKKSSTGYEIILFNRADVEPQNGG
jgi:hypothetical protein